MLKLGSDIIDPHVLTTIGANIIHLLFVKYEKDPDVAFKILMECIKLGVDVNLVDTLKAAPIHVALRKRQHQAISDMIKINELKGSQIFDLNVRDKKEMTPLHYVLEKQDHQMCISLLGSPDVDIYLLDGEFQRPKHLTVIFSAFHKMLYKKEKMAMLKVFKRELELSYIDFAQVMTA